MISGAITQFTALMSCFVSVLESRAFLLFLNNKQLAGFAQDSLV